MKKLKNDSSHKIRYFELFFDNQKKSNYNIKFDNIFDKNRTKTFSKKTHAFFFIKQADITVYF